MPAQQIRRGIKIRPVHSSWPRPGQGLETNRPTEPIKAHIMAT